MDENTISYVDTLPPDILLYEILLRMSINEIRQICSSHRRIHRICINDDVMLGTASALAAIAFTNPPLLAAAIALVLTVSFVLIPQIKSAVQSYRSEERRVG